MDKQDLLIFIRVFTYLCFVMKIVERNKDLERNFILFLRNFFFKFSQSNVSVVWLIRSSQVSDHFTREIRINYANPTPPP